MDTVLICRDALSSSLLSNLVFAIEAKKTGADVAILFTQEALAGLCGEAFAWSPGLRGQQRRFQIADRARTMDIPVSGRGDGRQVNARLLLGKAREAGVKMIACPIWTNLLAVEEKLPEGIEKTDLSQALKMIKGAKTVIGTL